MNEFNEDSGQKKTRIRATLYFAGSLVIAFGLTWLLKEPAFTDSQIYTLFLLFFAIGLWLTEPIPAFVVGLFIMAFLVFALGNHHFNSAPENIDKYVNTFSSSIIWLLLGGFFLASALTKTKLDQKFLKAAFSISGTKPRNMVIAIMMCTMLASMLMSNTATTAMVVAAITPLLNSKDQSGISKALLLGVSIAATIGGMGTIIGSPPNAIAAGMLENAGIQINFLTWMLYGLPVSIILTVISCWVLLKFFIKASEPVSLSFLDNNTIKKESESKVQSTIVLVVIMVTVLLWLTSSIHGISTAAVSAIPIVVLPMTGVLTGDDIRTMPWDTLLLVAGGLSLGVALQSTGILEHYAHQLKNMHVNNFIFLSILAYTTTIFSNIMSNSAASTILIPLGMAILSGLEEQAAIVVGLAASTALFLPVSTPPNAIVYSTGLLTQKDFRIGGILIGLLGPLLAVVWVVLISQT